MYKKAYSFIDELKGTEMFQLRKELGKEKDPELRAKLERALNIMEQRKLADQRYIINKIIIIIIFIY